MEEETGAIIPTGILGPRLQEEAPRSLMGTLGQRLMKERWRKWTVLIRAAVEVPLLETLLLTILKQPGAGESKFHTIVFRYFPKSYNTS